MIGVFSTCDDWLLVVCLVVGCLLYLFAAILFKVVLMGLVTLYGLIALVELFLFC